VESQGLTGQRGSAAPAARIRPARPSWRPARRGSPAPLRTGLAGLWGGLPLIVATGRPGRCGAAATAHRGRPTAQSL